MIQLQVLNKLLDTGDSSLILVNNIDKTFFSDYQNEFEFIKNHLDTYGNIPDMDTFLSKFPDFDVIKVSETNDYLIDSLYEDKNKRSLIRVFKNVRELLSDGNTEDAMQLYINAADNIVRAKHIDSVDILKDTEERYDRYLEVSQDYKKHRIRTGFKELDDMIGGWDRHEELATIAARTNQGKSWILLKVAIAGAEQGLKVGIYSGEMSVSKVGYRIDTLISNISNSGMVRGYREIQNQYKKYLDELPNRFSGSIKVLTPDKIGGPAGVTALRAFIEKEGLDMLCIDQHSLLEDDRHGRTPIEKASNISKDLKNLQVLKQIPIIAVSQLNRTKQEEGVVDSSMIAQSDRIGQDSTIMLFFEQKDGIMTMYLVKSRDSVNMKHIKYAINLDKGIFQYIPEEDNGLEDSSSCHDLATEFDGEDAFG